MWEISNYWQVLSLVRAAGLGAIYCVFYDLIRSLRVVNNFSGFTVFILDVLYFIIISPVTFCFLLSLTNGQLRGYVFLGIVLGFTAMRFTVSLILFKLFKLFFLYIFKALSYVKSIFYTAFNKAESFFCKFAVFLRKKFKKVLNNLKKGLKKA